MGKAKIHDEIIRRYDEVLSDKASKIAVEEFKQEIHELFTK